jgi:hypothetical protein
VFTDYLVDVRGICELGSHWPGKLTYHPSCHLLRILGVDRQPTVSFWPMSEKLKWLNFLNAKNAADLAASSWWNTPKFQQNS